MDQKLLDFMTETSETLGRIETKVDVQKEDIKDLKVKCEKIPLIEVGLNNHLSSHSRLKTLFIYPIAVIIGSGVLAALGRWVFKVPLLMR